MGQELATIIPLDAVDLALVEQLLDEAFEPGRQKRTAYRVREGMEALPALSFASLDENDFLVGSIQCWPVALTSPDPAGGKDRRVPMIMVGPVAVLPAHQGEGHGKALMTAMLKAVDPRAPLPLVMIGDPEYYDRFFGFSNKRTGGWQLPGPYEQARLLVRCHDSVALPESGLLGPWG